MDLEQARTSLNMTNNDTVIAALRILGSQGKLPDLQNIISLTKSTNISIQKAAIQSTSLLIRENLISHFHELQAEVREKLGLLLQSLTPSVINDICNDLYSSNEERRLRALQTLGLFQKNPQTKEILAKLIHNRDVKIRATAVNLLSKMIEPYDHDLILSLLNDKDLRVRANTIEALERLNNKRLIPILLRFRRDPNNRIRGNVIKALFNLGYLEFEQDILEMLNSTNNQMKISALWVTSKIKVTNPAIEDAIALCLLSDHKLVISHANNALSSQKSLRASGYIRYLSKLQ
jgi:HEAT repeat protein